MVRTAPLRIAMAAIGPRRLPEPACGSVPPSGDPKQTLYYVPGLREGLARRGWHEDTMERRGSPGEKRFTLDVVQGNAAEVKAAVEGFVADGHDLIIGISTAVIDIAKAATMGKPIPILFPDVSDPVGQGYAESLERPGGNITGVSPQLTQSTAGRLAHFHKLLGGQLRSILAIYDPNFGPSKQSVPLLRKAAAELGITVVERQVTSSDKRAEVKAIMEALQPKEVDGVFMLNDTNVVSSADLVFNRARDIGMPVMGVHDFMAEWGAVGAYPSTPRGDGNDLAGYVDRIAAGEKPATMPITIQQPYFTVNLARAGCLGTSPDPQTVAKADRVIR